MKVNTMPAVVYEQYGAPEVLQLKEVAKPTPKPHEVLIRIRATTVTSGDWRLRAADPFAVRLFYGLFKPKASILGHELAGDVEAVGVAVTKFKVGDRVFGSTGFGSGTYAQYITLPETGTLTMMPEGPDYNAAAAIPVGAMTALHFLRKAGLKAGEEVLIYGASGSVGSFAVQLAKHFGAKVTAVCSAANVPMMQQLGADEVIDYKKTDFTATGKTYDVVFDAVGKINFATGRKVLKPEGHYLSVGGGFAEYVRLMLPLGGQKVVVGPSSGGLEDLEYLKTLMELGKLHAVIDRSYALNELVEAHHYVGGGHKKGNVVVEVA